MKSDTLGAEVPLSSSDERDGNVEWTRRRKVISDRLESLSEVEDGWFEGRGVALDRAGLLWLEQRMADHYVATDLPLPFLCPGVDGGVIGEWMLERHTCMIEVDLDARTGSWVDVEMETGDGIDEQILDLDSADGWQWMIDRLRGFVGES